MLHHEGAVLDPPEALPGAESGQEALFGADEAERGRGGPRWSVSWRYMILVSAFASRLFASARFAEPRLPTISKSVSLWNTSRFASP